MALHRKNKQKAYCNILKTKKMKLIKLKDNYYLINGNISINSLVIWYGKDKIPFIKKVIDSRSIDSTGEEFLCSSTYNMWIEKKQLYNILASTEIYEGVHLLNKAKIETILGVVDVNDIAEKLLKANPDFKSEGLSEYQNGRLNGIIEGYEKCLKDNSKKITSWSVEEIKQWLVDVFGLIDNNPKEAKSQLSHLIKEIKTKEKTEWDVEVEMEYKDLAGGWYNYEENIGKHNPDIIEMPNRLKPKVTNGYVTILKTN